MKSLKFLLPVLIILFVWSCETVDPLIEEIQTGILIGNYDAAIETANRAIEEDSTNSLAYYYKGVALGQSAHMKEDPADRKPIYEETRKTLLESKKWMERAEDRPDEYDDVGEAIISFWAFEHNQGIDYLTDDSARAAVATPDEYALSNFINATVIEPDSALSYIALSSTHFNQGNLQSAISAYEDAMTRMSEPEFDDYDFLINLYILDEDFENAERLSIEAREYYPGETRLVQYLADIYIQTERTDEAIELVRDLIAEDPENPQLYRVLGTQIYQSVNAINQDISNLLEESFEVERDMRRASGSERDAKEAELDEMRNELDELIAQSRELTELAASEMKKVIELDDQDHESYNILGVIYQNEAANLFDQRNFTVDNERAQELDDEARYNLRQAQQYYERAAEIKPEEEEYWLALFQVYTTLGMEEEARDAMERAGM